jgi:hypothetical protein
MPRWILGLALAACAGALGGTKIASLTAQRAVLLPAHLPQQSDKLSPLNPPADLVLTNGKI